MVDDLEIAIVEQGMGQEVLSNRLDLAIIGAGGQSLICLGAVYLN